MAGLNITLLTAVFLCLAGLLTAGCNNMTKREVGCEKFIALYNKPRHPGDYWKYKGKSGDYHIMMHYSHIDQNGRVDGKSIPTAYEEVMIKVDQMPVGFPSSPQKEMVCSKLPDSINRVRDGNKGAP